MTMINLDELKSQAKNLRNALSAQGTQLSHAQALETLAKQRGYRDWNTLVAAAGNRPAASGYVLGQRVSGRYLGQPMSGEVIAVRPMGDSGHFRLTIQLDEPVDVVKFDSFSSFRSRINATVDSHGKTAAKTSDGQPHLQLEI